MLPLEAAAISEFYPGAEAQFALWDGLFQVLADAVLADGPVTWRDLCGDVVLAWEDGKRERPSRIVQGMIEHAEPKKMVERRTDAVGHGVEMFPSSMSA